MARRGDAHAIGQHHASAFSWFWCGIDPAALAIQVVLMVGTLAVAEAAVTYHGGPQWLTAAALIAASAVGGVLHAKWAGTDAPLPANAGSMFHVRTSARLACGLAAAFVIGHALIVRHANAENQTS